VQKPSQPKKNEKGSARKQPEKETDTLKHFGKDSVENEAEGKVLGFLIEKRWKKVLWSVELDGSKKRRKMGEWNGCPPLFQNIRKMNRSGKEKTRGGKGGKTEFVSHAKVEGTCNPTNSHVRQGEK